MRCNAAVPSFHTGAIETQRGKQLKTTGVSGGCWAVYCLDDLQPPLVMIDGIYHYLIIGPLAVWEGLFNVNIQPWLQLSRRLAFAICLWLRNRQPSVRSSSEAASRCESVIPWSMPSARPRVCVCVSARARVCPQDWQGEEPGIFSVWLEELVPWNKWLARFLMTDLLLCLAHLLLARPSLLGSALTEAQTIKASKERNAWSWSHLCYGKQRVYYGDRMKSQVF